MYILTSNTICIVKLCFCTPPPPGDVVTWLSGRLASLFSQPSLLIAFQIYYIFKYSTSLNIDIFQRFFFFTIVFLYKGGAIIFRDLSEACIMLSDLRGTLNISHIGEKGSPYHTGYETLKISNCLILSDPSSKYIPSHQNPLSK